MYNSNKYTETLHHLKPKLDTPNYAEAVVLKTVCVVHYLAPHAACYQLVASLRMVTPGAEFRGVAFYNV